MNFNFFSSGWCHCFHLLFRILLNVWDKAVAAIVVNWFIYFQKIVLHFLFNIFFFWSISTTNNQKRKSNYTTIDLNNITMYISQFLYIWEQHFLDKIFWLSSLNWPSIPKIWSRRIWTGSKMLHTKMFPNNQLKWKSIQFICKKYIMVNVLFNWCFF